MNADVYSNLLNDFVMLNWSAIRIMHWSSSKCSRWNAAWSLQKNKMDISWTYKAEHGAAHLTKLAFILISYSLVFAC